MTEGGDAVAPTFFGEQRWETGERHLTPRPPLYTGEGGDGNGQVVGERGGVWRMEDGAVGVRLPQIHLSGKVSSFFNSEKGVTIG